MKQIIFCCLLLVLSCVSCGLGLVSRQENQDEEPFEVVYEDSLYDCSRKQTYSRTTRQMVPLGHTEVPLLDGSSISFTANAFIEENKTLTIHSMMRGSLNHLPKGLVPRSPPSTFNTGFRPNRPPIKIMFKEAVADFTLRMIMNGLHGFISLAGLGTENKQVPKMINVSVAISC